MIKMEFDTDLWALNRKWTAFISWWPTAPTLHHGGEPDWLFWCWWDLVDSWTLDITGWWKDRLRFSTPTGRSTLSLPVPVYLVKPAWPWRWLRYKIENRLRTVYVHPLLRQVIGKIALDCDTCKDGPGERTSLAEVLAPTMITRGRNLWYEKII